MSPYSDSGNNLVKLADALGERRWAGLQDVRGFDFVDAPSLDGRQRAPARARRNLVLLHCFAAPGSNDHVGRAPHDLLRRDDAVFRELGVAKLRKDRIAAGNLDQLLDPLDARDEWVVPLFEIDAGPDREGRGLLADRREVR